MRKYNLSITVTKYFTPCSREFKHVLNQGFSRILGTLPIPMELGISAMF
jgi:hypothetical protein